MELKEATQTVLLRYLGVPPCGARPSKDADTGSCVDSIRKGRRLMEPQLSRDRRRLGVIRNLDTAEFDYLIGVLFSLDFSTVEAYKIPHALIHDFARFSSHQNGHILQLRGSILNAPGVEEISQVLADHP